MFNAQQCHSIREHGFVVCPNVFDVSVVKQTKDHISTLALKKANVGNTPNNHIDIRGDLIHWIEPNGGDVEQYWTRQLEQLRTTLNEQLMVNATNFEAHFAQYKPPSGYKRHKDTFAHNNKRVVSAVMYLNEDWCEDFGGQLRLYAEQTTDVVPLAGTLVVFDSHMEHEVLPALQSRYSIAAWFRQS